MYVPTPFKESRTEVLHELIKTRPFGVLVIYGENGLDANHLPFELDTTQGELGVLRAHVARSNPLCRSMGDGDEVLVVFSAADAYVSPAWYPSKHEFQKQVPTWNYMVVHAYGRIAVRDEERFVRGVVARLTRTHEASQPTPWKMTDSSPDYINSLLKAIVGLEIAITRLVGKSKLGQDEELRDICGAGNALKDRGNTVIGEAMLAHARTILPEAE